MIFDAFPFSSFLLGFFDIRCSRFLWIHISSAFYSLLQYFLHVLVFGARQKELLKRLFPFLPPHSFPTRNSRNGATKSDPDTSVAAIHTFLVFILLPPHAEASISHIRIWDVWQKNRNFRFSRFLYYSTPRAVWSDMAAGYMSGKSTRIEVFAWRLLCRLGICYPVCASSDLQDGCTSSPLASRHFKGVSCLDPPACCHCILWLNGCREDRYCDFKVLISFW